MKLAHPTSAPKLRQPKLYPVAVIFAACITVVTVALLFFLDKILEYVTLEGAGGVGGMVVVIATATAGVFSLPYLLRIPVSPLMRLVSCLAMFGVVAGVMLGAWWVRLNVVTPYATAGLMGAYISLLLAITSVWVIGVDAPLLKKRR